MSATSFAKFVNGGKGAEDGEFLPFLIGGITTAMLILVGQFWQDAISTFVTTYSEKNTIAAKFWTAIIFSFIAFTTLYLLYKYSN